MFHVMLVLPMLIIAVVVFAILVFGLVIGLFTILASVAGGASAALLVKNKSIKRLIFIGLCILSFVGLICILPFVTLYAQLSMLFIILATVIACVCIGVLAIVGIMQSRGIQNKVGKTVLTVVFSLILAAAALVAILVPIVGGLLFS